MNSVICTYCEHVKMECEPAKINASSFAVNLSTSGLSVAVIVSRKIRQMRAQPFSNASYYNYLPRCGEGDAQDGSRDA